jgi:hypothetical protein
MITGYKRLFQKGPLQLSSVIVNNLRSPSACLNNPTVVAYLD